MEVARILEAKGGQVVTMRADARVAEVAARLKRSRIGAIVIEGDDGAIAGIVSERDIVHALVEYGHDLPDQPIGSLMTRAVITCRPRDKVHEIMRRMTECRIRHLPVTEDDALVGIISIGDIVKHRLEELEDESSQLREYIASA